MIMRSIKAEPHSESDGVGFFFDMKHVVTKIVI